MTNPKHKYKNKADIKFNVKNIGKPYVTNGIPNYFESTIVKIWIITVTQIK